MLRGLLSILALGCCLDSAVLANACQETTREYRLQGDRIRLLSYERKPMSHVNVVIRAAFGETRQQTHWGKPVGEVVQHGVTDSRGYFKLKRLEAGEWWISYVDVQKGETFLVVREKGAKGKPLDLKLNDLGGMCYLFDIERNTTKPTGWHKPLKTN